MICRVMLMVTAGCCAAAAGETQPLFNGKDLTGWTGADGKPVRGDGWKVENGVLHRAAKGGDLFTEKEYGDFTLEFEWKIAAGANSGVKYRVQAYDGKGLLGFEYQLLDDAKHPDAIAGAKRRTASLYDILPPAAGAIVHPPGEWNASKIVVKGAKIEHWLNGARVLETETSSESFRKARSGSKFKSVPAFGENPRGRIMLQDHGNEVWFRNLRITED